VLSLALFSGCSKRPEGGPPRFEVGGNVIFAGKPVPYGVIEFTPTDGLDVPASSANIENGAFSVDRGLLKGTYQVKITGSKTPATDAASMDAVATTPPVKEFIPAKYNSESKLELVVHSNIPHQEFHLE